MRTLITGQSGRLGRVVLETFGARGDEIWYKPEALNYLVFAHRYRGPLSFVDEMQANLLDVIAMIDSTTWAVGDKSIVLVSSVSATGPAENQTLAYNLSKAALNQLARCYAKNHRINTVSPDTFTGEAAVVTKQQVADVIAFLCSPAASGIRGQDIRVSG